MDTHSHEELYECTLCEFSFALKEDLETHIKNHIGGLSFQCHVCDKVFLIENDIFNTALVIPPW